MTIDGTNISEFKMRLLKLDDYFNLQAKKRKLTAVGDLDAAQLEGKTATVTLMGKYSDAADLISNLNDFETLLKSTLKHDVVLISHSISFSGVFANGYEVIPFDGGKIVKVIATIAII